MSLTVHGVSHQMGQESRLVLDHIDLSLPAGKITLLMGQPGAGKSTLLLLMAGILRPTTGVVTLDGYPIWRHKRIRSELQKRLGIVFQYPDKQLFARTVAGEFTYSLRPYHLSKNEIAHRSHEALTQVGLSAEIMADSPLFLSGGQKRRVALATTLATRPDWLFLDEPSAGLDPQGLHSLLQDIPRWKSQLTGGIVIATHDLEAFLPVADQAVILKDGRVVHTCSGPDLCRQPLPLAMAGVGLPTPLSLHQKLTEAGWPLPDGCLDPEALADALAVSLSPLQRQEPPVHRTPTDVSLQPRVITPSSAAPEDGRQTTRQPETRQAHPSGLGRFDPRANWILVTLLSIGILLQSSWLAVGISALVCLAMLSISRLSWHRWWTPIRPFAVLTLLTGILAGLRFGPRERDAFHLGGLWFSVSAASVTLLSMTKVLEVLSIGVVFSTSQKPSSLQRALRQSLAWAAPRRHWPDAVSLGTGLVLRFIPVLMSEMERFSMLARARGKSSAKPGQVRLRDVRGMMIPMLLSVLQFGEDLTLAMAARGYRETGQPRTDHTHLQMHRRDYFLLSVGLGIFLALAGMHVVAH